MKLLTTTPDKKITAVNHLIEMTIGEYSTVATEILHNNNLQRKRVKTANRSYSLLKDDIKEGCVIPPIVLAIFPKDGSTMSNLSSDNIIERFFSAGADLLILDGLQRTYTILDLLNEENDEEIRKSINNLPLRIEIYTGISKVGVLYRMLTLNTGQTPMSTRQQVEMLYSDYKNGIDGLTFISEAEGRTPSGENEFKFSDVLDGFLSYITGDYLPIDREDLIATIKNLETLTKQDKNKDVFKLLISSFNAFRIKAKAIAQDWRFDPEDNDLTRKAFALTVNDLFTKVQLIAGYGAAISFLIENNIVDSLEAITDKIDDLNTEDIDSAMDLMMSHLDEIQVNAKKIGNEQRMYFYYFVRSIFNESNEAYLDWNKAVLQAYKFYKANTLR